MDIKNEAYNEDTVKSFVFHDSKINQKTLEDYHNNYFLKKKYSMAPSTSQLSLSDSKLRPIHEYSELSRYKKLLSDAFKREVPLIYFNANQKETILKEARFIELLEEETILYQCVNDISQPKHLSSFNTQLENSNRIKDEDKESFTVSNINFQEDRLQDGVNPLLMEKKNSIVNNLKINDNYHCYIILKGEIHCFDKDNNFTEQLTPGTFFGYEGPIFEKRNSTAIAQKGSIICVINKDCFLDIVEPFSKFCNYLQQCVIVKDKFFNHLDNYKNFILNSINDGPINLKKAIEKFVKINSCLHPKCNSNEIDFSAWSYAVDRLPPGIFDVFCINLVNTSTKLMTMGNDIFNQFVKLRTCSTRNRSIYEYLPGKYLVVVRDMETDVLDFIANMCIHLIESSKLRNIISSPIGYKLLSKVKNDNEAIDAFEELYGNPLSDEDRSRMSKIFPDNIGKRLINLCMHYQNYNVNIIKKSISRKESSENWIQNIWKYAIDLLEASSSVDEVEDLVVDIMQGSKSTLLSCISPHMYKNKDKILSWANKKNITFKTKSFNNDNDRLIAASHYYYKAFPEELVEKKKMNYEHGIQILEETFSTGVQVMLINVNKLSKEFIDPSVQLKSASKNHLILHIGYTFGAQSAHMIKPILMLFGSKARSLNIIGKAGSLVGDRTDILVADKMFYDKNQDLIPIQTGNIDCEKIRKEGKCNVHLGPMLCVAGTILQNNDLLRYYKYVNGCVGLEMEGYFYVQEVDKAMRSGLLGKDFITRCFYYASDLPLDPTQNLSMETGNISWEEGVGSMIAIQRYVLQELFT